MVMAMRGVGDKEGEGSKAMAMATTLVGKWTAMATKRVMTLVRRVAGKKWLWQQRGQWQQQQQWWTVKRAIATVARALVMAMRVAVEHQQQGQWH
jgi:hypothetical protein